MPKLSAIIHAHNDALRLGRALESLRPFDDVLVIDHGSSDATAPTAREHGARVIRGVSEAGSCVDRARHDWIFCLLPNETLSEGLEASLFEFRDLAEEPSGSFSVAVREDTGDGWQNRASETRLVHRHRLSWTAPLPPNDSNSILLEGALLRFRQP